MSKKKILITGGAGFLGSHLALKAIKEGYDILIIDSFNSETSPIGQKDLNIEAVFKTAKFYQANVEIFRIDITSQSDLQIFFDKQRPNIIIHAAALTMDRASMDLPLDFIKTNIAGTQLLLDELLRIHSLEQFIFISTRSAVGLAAAEDESIREDQYFKPINPYGASKAAAESFLHSYHFDTKVPVKICRMQPMYGPRCRHDMFPFRLLNAHIKNAQVIKYGSGEGIRDWLYIDDAVEAIFKIAHIEKQFEIFNIGTGIPTSTNELISICEQVIGSKIKIENIDPVRGDAHFAGVADISKIQNMCGWEPKILLREGIERTLEYMKSNPYILEELGEN
ncbi:MAG: NAD(P)-dependent oxidoreductase [Gammaproteobacteria bacterium]|jgi:UDP-glucuronate 4-epimerase